MRYIWQNTAWPNFKYDLTNVQDILYNYIRDMSSLSSRLDEIQAAYSKDAVVDIIVAEALKTSEIEGEYYNETNLRSSVKKILGLTVDIKTSDKKAESLSYLMLEARSTFNKPLTEKMLFHWHKLLMQESKLDPAYIANWRKSEAPMQIISGPIGNEKVHYEAPPSAIVAYEMNRFIEWFNNSNGILPGPIRSAIAHLYFEIIHPFEDGNGRIGRVIAEKALSQDLKIPILISLSSEIMKNKKEYYNALFKASQDNIDITPFLLYFTSIIYNAHLSTKDKIEFILKKARFWQEFDSILNDRQKKVITRIFAAVTDGFEGDLSAKKYMQITSCSKATATRDLTNLLEKKALKILSFGGRSTRYEIN